MSVLVPSPASDLDFYAKTAILASPFTLAVLRSMSDGQWATIADLCAATGATDEQVLTTFSVMSDQCLEQLGEFYRMNCESVQDNLDALAASFGATLVSRD